MPTVGLSGWAWLHSDVVRYTTAAFSIGDIFLDEEPVPVRTRVSLSRSGGRARRLPD